MEVDILQPLDAYQRELKEKHRQLTEEYFDNLVKQSGVSAEENAQIIDQRNQTLKRLSDSDKYVRKNKSLRTFLIVCIVALFVGALISIFAFMDNEEGLFFLTILLPILFVAGAIGLIVLICKVINKRIKQGKEQSAKLREEANKLESQAWQQMAPLNRKYDWNIPDKLIYETVPQIQLDKYFDENKYAYFTQNIGLQVENRDDVSAYCARSGNSDGNPFLLMRYMYHQMIDFVYTGTRTVTWTEVETDSQGHTRTVTHSETLVAHVTKPKPDYFFRTYLYYGSSAAPDLHFSRTPVVPSGSSDKAINSLVKSGEKRLEKKTREAIKNGETYNKLANSEFEVLFGADNRDNEVQFRMLFTPLAQQNMVKLLRSQQPYGDDFTFEKRGRVNIIFSRHGSELNIDANPAQFVDFDLAKAKETFVNYNVNYFKSLYFDFAPLFSVPIYTQERPEQAFGECTDHANIGECEMEAVANFFDPKLISHPETVTDTIVKVKHVAETDKGCVAEITGYSFKGIPRVDFVPVWCRNGHTYDVEVPWIEYIPLSQVTNVEMSAVTLTREEYLGAESAGGDNEVFFGGIVARLLPETAKK